MCKSGVQFNAWMVLTVILAAIVSLGFSSLSRAATVSTQTGMVLIRTDAGFTRITRMTTVAAGAQIVVSPGGIAQVNFGKDSVCVVLLGDGQVWTVPRSSPCVDGQRVVDLTRQEQVHAGSRAAVQKWPSPTITRHPLPASRFSYTGTAILGGVAIGIGAIVATSGGGDKPNPPASP